MLVYGGYRGGRMDWEEEMMKQILSRTIFSSLGVGLVVFVLDYCECST